MSDDLKNILSDADGTAGQEQLLKYLREQLTQEENHELEKHLVDDSFESDAVEGLQQLENNEKIELIVDALNRDLKRRTAGKKEARERLRLKPQWGLYFSILILLIIVVLIFFYLRYKMGT